MSIALPGSIGEPQRLPIPRPQELKGQLWAVTTFFNPEGYANKKENYDRFRAGLRAAGVPLCCVELAFGERPHELAEEDSELLVKLRGGDILWQKERLLNHAVSCLPPDCDKVAWLDADILFERPDWAQSLREELALYPVVQPYSHSLRLCEGEEGPPPGVEALSSGTGEHEVLHSMAWGVAHYGTPCLARYLQHGHTGYAWAARRSLLARHGLYEASILGNGDLNIAQAFFAGCRFLKTERAPAPAARHLMGWAERIYADVRSSVGWVDGFVYHLWHGDKVDRLYDRRLDLLLQYDFDPLLDLRRGDDHCLHWASEKPGLHDWCRDYFAMRKEA